MANIKVVAAPEKMGGDGIDLQPLLGKMVGVYCRARDTKSTKFGDRSMTHVVVLAEGAKSGDDSLEGIMFQTYFQDLKIGQWYVGIVAQVKTGTGRNVNMAWVLDSSKLAKTKIDPFVKLLATVEIGNTSEVVL